jgi:putative membrane protein
MSTPLPEDPRHTSPALDDRDPRLDGTDGPRTERARETARRRAEGPAHATGSRTSGVFVASVAGALVLLVLLVFILQNLERVPIEFLFLEGRVPVGVALLLAAVAGALLVALAGGARVLQLRRRAGTWKR